MQAVWNDAFACICGRVQRRCCIRLPAASPRPDAGFADCLNTWLVRVAGRNGGRWSGSMVPACDAAGPWIEGRVPWNCRSKSLTRMPGTVRRPCGAARTAAGGRLSGVSLPRSAPGRSSVAGARRRCQSQAGRLRNKPQHSSRSRPEMSQPGWAPRLRRSSTVAWGGPAPLLLTVSLTSWRVGLRRIPGSDPSAHAVCNVAVPANTLASWTQ